MSTTVKQVFDLTVQLMGEADEVSGATETSGTAEYKTRTIPILNVLQYECYALSDTYTATSAGKRPTPPLLTGFSSAIGLDDGVCLSVLPYGLASHLLLEENAKLASFFLDRYEEQKTRFGRIPGEFSPIEDSYGGIEGGGFSAW